MSSQRRIVYCEICGREISEKASFKIFVEGSMITVCPECYSKYVMQRSSRERSAREPVERTATRTLIRESKTTSLKRVTSQSIRSLERYEIDPMYPEIIRKAREAKNMSTKDLAMRLRESENVIKRIESGKLTPTIELAKRIEEVLGVRIVVPRVEEREEQMSRTSTSSGVTLGDLVVVKKREGK
ncbi:MAG: multiprotein bridging factor aMBF1 [Sulfolobales archaeon]